MKPLIPERKYDFSIITVCYNAASSIQRTIDSVIAQKGVSIQYIIIDGASSDGTLAILEGNKNAIDILVSEPDDGIYHAMNKGIALATGEHIAMLNADDALLIGTLEKVLKKFHDTGAAIVHGNMIKERLIGGKIFEKVQRPPFEDMMKTMGVNHPSTFVKRKVYKELGAFDTRYQLSADYDFILRAFKSGESFSFLDEPLTRFRIDGRSNTGCKSFYESFLVHLRHKTGHSSKRLLMIPQCALKNTLRQVLHMTVRLFGLNNWMNDRLIRKWSH